MEDRYLQMIIDSCYLFFKHISGREAGQKRIQFPNLIYLKEVSMFKLKVKGGVSASVLK
jgi:hypothetical protein